MYVCMYLCSTSSAIMRYMDYMYIQDRVKSTRDAFQAVQNVIANATSPGMDVEEGERDLNSTLKKQVAALDSLKSAQDQASDSAQTQSGLELQREVSRQRAMLALLRQEVKQERSRGQVALSHTSPDALPFSLYIYIYIFMFIFT